ncbi:hypothetical protein [Mycobacterium attenuatum]|uniref:hypothetical protein n=1 Tax=Mycobacterium attenuatum TaxID=2341086 RepID=UPI000F217F54|nr:hypothetical protein [Mycobacterium attenuatum]VBA60409.1 hypothetical protein LAUMK191_05509 [Mycobacterium attenuatum]VBA62305.1 hypothetical protein LAUMK41_05696 [Mycobacterium attenuatum]
MSYAPECLTALDGQRRQLIGRCRIIGKAERRQGRQAGLGNATAVMDNGYMVTNLNDPSNAARRLELIVTGIITTPRVPYRAPAFVVTAHGTRVPFSIDEDAFSAWVADESDWLPHQLPDPADASPGSTLADLVYEALSSGVLVGDAGLELNIHGDVDEAGYIMRINNLAGQQLSVALTRGWHELHWPPGGLTPSESARHHLTEVCCNANTLLKDLLAAAS